MCLAKTYLPHAHSNICSCAHTQTRLPLELANKQTPTPPRLPYIHTYNHRHTCTLHSFCQHSQTKQHCAVREKERKKAEVGCDWRVHCSGNTNLHTRRLRSEYAWGNKTICLQADHPLALDYCSHLRAFYLLAGVQSSWFSVHWSHAKDWTLRDVNLLRKKISSPTHWGKLNNNKKEVYQGNLC